VPALQKAFRQQYVPPHFAALILFVINRVGLGQQELLNFPANAERRVKAIRCTGLNVVARSPARADALIDGKAPVEGWFGFL